MKYWRAYCIEHSCFSFVMTCFGVGLHSFSVLPYCDLFSQYWLWFINSNVTWACFELVLNANLGLYSMLTWSCISVKLFYTQKFTWVCVGLGLFSWADIQVLTCLRNSGRHCNRYLLKLKTKPRGLKATPSSGKWWGFWWTFLQG